MLLGYFLQATNGIHFKNKRILSDSKPKVTEALKDSSSEVRQAPLKYKDETFELIKQWIDHKALNLHCSLRQEVLQQKLSHYLH